MNDVCRARPSRPSTRRCASLVKICRSGQNRMRVPVLVFDDPAALAGQARLLLERRVRAVAGEDTRHPAPEAHALLGGRAVDVDVEPGGQRVDDRGADAVQAAGRDVRRAAELAARVQLGEDHLDAREPGLGLLVDRDAAAVVVHLGRAVGVERDLDQVAGAGQGLVHAVVDDLPQAVHETAGVGGPDVHARALADRLQPLEDEKVCCVVGVVGDRAAPGSAARRSSLSRSRDYRRHAEPGAGTLPGWTAVRVYRGDITKRTRFRYRVLRNSNRTSSRNRHTQQQQIRRSADRALPRSGDSQHRGTIGRDGIACRTTRRDWGVRRNVLHPGYVEPTPNTIEK